MWLWQRSKNVFGMASKLGRIARLAPRSLSRRARSEARSTSTDRPTCTFGRAARRENIEVFFQIEEVGQVRAMVVRLRN
jgi:hypothetical protein